MMKKLLYTAAAVFALAGVANAADAVTQVPAAPAVEDAPVVFTWSGPYIGIQGGYGWGDADSTISGAPVTFGSDLDGGLFGAFVGYNYQFSNNLVLGVEGDVDYNWNEDGITAGAELKTEWQGSARVRLGYAFDRALIYATGGWAGTRGEASVPGFGERSETFSGYTVGAGLDYAFTDNIFARVEYRYTDFGSETFDFGAGTIDTDFNQHAVKVGLGVKF